MTRTNLHSTLLLAGLAGTVLALGTSQHAQAQTCPGTWSDQFAIAGVGVNIVDAVVWDDGTGPGLYAVGSFSGTVIGGIEYRLLPAQLGLLTVANNVAKWDGRQWRVVGSPFLESQSAILGLNAINTIQVYDPDGPGPLTSILVVGGRANSSSSFDAPNTTLQFDGTSWQQFGTLLSAEAVGAEVFDLEVFNGDLYAAGRFTGNGFESIARWDRTTQAWADVGGGIPQTDDTVRVERLVVSAADSSGTPALYIGGTFDYVGTNFDFIQRLVKWDGTAFSAVPGFQRTSALVDYTFGAPTMLRSLDLGDGPRLLVGDAIYAGLTGSATTIGVSLAQLKNGVWSTLIPQTTSVNKSQSFDAAVYPGPSGQQLHVVGSRLLNSISGQPTGVGLARLNTNNTWAPLGLPVIPNSAGAARLLLPVDWDFAGPGGTKLFMAAAPTYRGLFLGQFNGLSPINIALWDGTTVGLANSGSDALGVSANVIKELDPDGSGPLPTALYIGHSSPLVRGRASTTGLVTFDGTGYTQIGSGVVNVSAIQSFTPANANTNLYAAGQTSNDSPPGVYRLDGAAWTLVGPMPFYGPNESYVSAIEDLVSATVDGEPSLIAAGSFLEIAGVPARFVARYNGSAWTAMDAGMPPAILPNSDYIYLTGQKQGLVLVNGTPWLRITYTYFNNGSPLPHRNEIYRWNGSSWDLVISIPGATFNIESLSNGSGDDLYVFGNFRNLAGVSGVSMIAKWNGTAFESVGAEIEFNHPQAMISSVGSHDFGSGRRLVAVIDWFSTTGGQSVTGLLKLENGHWEQVPGGITARFATGITSSTNPQWGGLYLAGPLLRNIGGTYLNVDTIESRGIARYMNPTVPCNPVQPRCNPADIAFDDGTPLPPVGVPGGTNNGVTEGDYNLFFAQFFDANAAVDIANDDGSPLPPFGPLTTNNGVTEGDYNLFFSIFFDGCAF